MTKHDCKKHVLDKKENFHIDQFPSFFFFFLNKKIKNILFFSLGLISYFMSYEVDGCIYKPDTDEAKSRFFYLK